MIGETVRKLEGYRPYGEIYKVTNEWLGDQVDEYGQWQIQITNKDGQNEFTRTDRVTKWHKDLPIDDTPPVSLVSSDSSEELMEFELRRGSQRYGGSATSRIAGHNIRDVFDIKFTTLDGRAVHTKAGFTKSEFNKLLRDFLEAGEINKKTAAAIRKEMNTAR
jgi:hypothetical protein